MSDWNQKQGQNQGGQWQSGQGDHGSQGGQGQSGQGGQGGQGQSGQGGHGKSGQGTQAQGGAGAWVWLRWNDSAPEATRQALGNTGYKSWHCNNGEWNCKFWVPAATEAEAKKAFESKIGNKEHIKDTKYEWNWNQSAAA